jgi:hypothetical protein
VELREETRDRLRGGLHVELYEYWTDKPHKRRKGTGMNLENVGMKIWTSVYHSVVISVYHYVVVSVWDSVVDSVWNSVDDSVLDSVWNSVSIRLQDPIIEERRRG